MFHKQSLLPKKLLPQFKNYLLSAGYHELPIMTNKEVLRMDSGRNRYITVTEKEGKPDYYIVSRLGGKLLTQFLREMKALR